MQCRGLTNAGIPRTRLAFAIEKLVREMEAGYICELSQRGLLMLLWIFTRLKPTVRMVHLRCLDCTLPV